MPQTIANPEIAGPGTGSGRWMVVIYNNDTTPYDRVVAILIRATGCGLEEAQTETWEAHHFGKAPVHFAPKEECDTAAGMIRKIGVKTDVCPEWEDA